MPPKIEAMWTRVEEILVWLVTATIAAVTTGAWWLIRRIFTNQQQIDLLRQEMAHRDKLRGEDREALADVRDGVKRIEGWIMEQKK